MEKFWNCFKWVVESHLFWKWPFQFQFHFVLNLIPHSPVTGDSLKNKSFLTVNCCSLLLFLKTHLSFFSFFHFLWKLKNFGNKFGSPQLTLRTDWTKRQFCFFLSHFSRNILANKNIAHTHIKRSGRLHSWIRQVNTKDKKDKKLKTLLGKKVILDFHFSMSLSLFR